jgi:hypothetical protein
MGVTNHGLVGRPDQGVRPSPLQPLGRNEREIDRTNSSGLLGALLSPPDLEAGQVAAGRPGGGGGGWGGEAGRRGRRRSGGGGRRLG